MTFIVYFDYICICSGINDIFLVLEPGLLEPSTLYRVRVVGIHNDATGFTETELSANLPPYDGECWISPEEGLMSLKFIIIDVYLFNSFQLYYTFNTFSYLVINLYFKLGLQYNDYS